MTIAAGLNDIEEFVRWRISVWDVIAYRRQVCRWWHGVSLRIWLCRDQTIRGVVALGAITETEFQMAFGLRWPMILRRIEPETAGDVIVAVVRPNMIIADDPERARYQPRQMTVRPRRARMVPKPSVSVPLYNPFDEPMPVLIE
ncbi:hypothetical protein [Microvirga arabica]|uniref:hypothetical protein n=1 Tax=Microvirga arabica TaxID=1128671 RepID=UPI00193ABF46|nr:hypothetical protein [Microvirga arabica]MBM1169626.1 hypothetical protein [Microvirga arabica]